MTADVVRALEAAPVLRELCDHDLAALAASAKLCRLGARDHLWRAGEPARHLGVVVSGRLKVVRHAVPRDLITEVIGAGDLAGEVALALHRSYCFDVVCLRRAAVVLVPAAQVCAALDRTPRAARALAAELANDVLRLTRRLESLHARTVEQRLARVLLSLMERFGERLDGSGVLVPVRLRRDELASLAATTLESTSRRLSQWQRAAIVQPQPAGFLVRDEPALRRLVDGED